MKRSPLKRRTPLKRTRLRRGGSSSKYASRERDVAFMLWVKEQDCLCCRGCSGDVGVGLTSCDGPVEADHAGDRCWGAFHKAPDSTCIPLCRKHHSERTDVRGYFEGFTAQRMRAWCEHAISITRALALRRGFVLVMSDDGVYHMTR